MRREARRWRLRVSDNLKDKAFECASPNNIRDSKSKSHSVKITISMEGLCPVDRRPGCVVVDELRSSYLPYLQALALLTQLKLLACLLNMKPSNHSSGQVLVGDDSLHTVHSLGDVTAAKPMNAYY